MSDQTWIDEFYPTPACEFEGDAVDALRHSLQKWRGAREGALAAHALHKVPVYFNDSTCALCSLFYDGGRCSRCPLYDSAGERRCDGSGPGFGGQEASPFGQWCYHGNPEPMIEALERALTKYENS
jgi:hypothetical protein